MISTGISRRNGSTARADWSVVVPIIGWILNVVVLFLSRHFGNLSTMAGINESNKAGIAIFFVAAAVDAAFGIAGMIVAISAKRVIRSSGDDGGDMVATIGVVLSATLIGLGFFMLAVALFLNALS